MPDPILILGGVVLAKYVSTGVGSIAGPILAGWKAAREGRAEVASAKYRAEVRRIEAQAEADTLADYV